MPTNKIEHYMKQVADFNRNGGMAPLGYNPEDKDSGYRSALRFWGIERSSNTDLVARKMIYGER